MKISKRKIEIMKSIVIGILLGVMITLVCTCLRLMIERDAAREMIEPPRKIYPTPKEYERAREVIPMPVVPDTELTPTEYLRIASLYPELFTDEEIVNLLIQ
jgi:hypothetical protein